ncbi:hypothetical protein [Actinoplanes sp. L3-i22]|uniref:hypothetical protein n=1 Tax=Actinoplanes sp. L3-i22 TaxID=2836373 RepID=UPI001C785BE4|nr:hypothetical protein [Actinoplanes sp. L3-i22]BCY11416.1 hypothetical protein L3i22_065040 [Actinoplanes sp. L3-i22]
MHLDDNTTARPVALPPSPPGDLAGGIRDWITSAPLRELVAASGGRLPGGGTAELLAWLDDFSGAHWDFRRGSLERHMMDPQDFGTPVLAAIDRAATALGLVTAHPPSRREYTHLLVLGGLGATCLQRADYAARLWRSGAVGSPRVAGLGSFRPLHETELATPGLAGCVTEVDAMRAGLRASFALGEPVEHRGTTGPAGHDSWSITDFTAPGATTIQAAAGATTVQVLAAPSAEPELRRADTSDTYRFWAGEHRPGPGDAVLIVTSPIYVPFQHADAIRLLNLPYGCPVDTVGLDSEQSFGPERYLQEIRSAVRSLRKLHQTYEPPPR